MLISLPLRDSKKRKEEKRKKKKREKKGEPKREKQKTKKKSAVLLNIRTGKIRKLAGGPSNGPLLQWTLIQCYQQKKKKSVEPIHRLPQPVLFPRRPYTGLTDSWRSISIFPSNLSRLIARPKRYITYHHGNRVKKKKKRSNRSQCSARAAAPAGTMQALHSTPSYSAAYPYSMVPRFMAPTLELAASKRGGPRS